MKKYIIISGVPRAGKSTVSQMIAKKYGYQHISMDSIIAGIEKTFPETGVDTHADVSEKENITYISSKMAPFIRAMMKSGEYDECSYGVVIDIYQLLPKDALTYLDADRCEIYYLLTAQVSPEERFQMLKQYDTPNDYTYYDPDDEKREACASIVEMSQYIQEECIKYGCSYLETSKNRTEVLSEFVDSLCR